MKEGSQALDNSLKKIHKRLPSLGTMTMTESKVFENRAVLQ